MSDETQRDEAEVSARELIGQTFREKGMGRGVKRWTITLTERIPYWGWRARRDDGPWQLTDRALDDYYAPVPASSTQQKQNNPSSRGEV